MLWSKVAFTCAACTSGRRRSAERHRSSICLVTSSPKLLMVPLLAEVPQLICHVLQDLIRELLPSPQCCLEEIHALLPQLAAQRYQELVEEVSH